MAQQDKSWENSWKSAFEGKSVTPPAGAWENIEKELEEKKSTRIAPIWWSAAAAVGLLAISFIVVDNNFVSDLSSGQEISSQEKTDVTNKEKPGTSDDNFDDSQQGNSALSFNEEEEEKETVADPGAGDEDKSKVSSGNDSKPEDLQLLIAANGKAEVTEGINILEREPVEVEFLAGLPAVVFEHKISEIPELWGVPVYSNSRKIREKGWYAGVDLAKGSSGADNGFSSGDQDFATPNSQLRSSYFSDSESGSTITYGLSVGKKISKRIILESGVNYRRIESSSVSNIAYNSGGSRSVFNNNTAYSNDGSLESTSFYEMENVHQFISIPLKAGYLILDKKWKMSVNTGVAGDYFFKTSTHDTSGNFSSYETKPSRSDNWNSLSVSVLGEVNITRQIGEHYILSLTPQLRQALSDFSNSDRQELKPAIIQLGMQLQYKF